MLGQGSLQLFAHHDDGGLHDPMIGLAYGSKRICVQKHQRFLI